MLFLLRTAFWLTIVLALLPSGGAPPVASGPKVTDAVSAAGAAISDLWHFCAREPEACEVGSQAATMIGQRAQAGAKMLYDLINEQTAPGATGSVSGGKPAATAIADAGAQPAADAVPAARGVERR